MRSVRSRASTRAVLQSLVCRCTLVALVAGALPAGIAHAEYPGHDGEQAYDLNSYNDTEGGPPYTLVDALQTRERTLAACRKPRPIGG